MTGGKKPIYQAIIDDILQKIEQGVYVPGIMLPSENRMAEIYDTSVPTVRKALGDLVYQKVIYRVKGKGTFVTQRNDLQEAGGEGAGKRQDTESGIAVQGNIKKNARLCFMVLADTSDSSIMKMIRGAQIYLMSRGYTMSILCGDEKAEDEADLVKECINRKMEGVIWFSMLPEANPEGVKLFAQNRVPVVMLDRGPKQLPFTLVSAYNLDGGYQMGTYLTGLGHRRIAFAADRMELAAEQDRIRGYASALMQRGIAYDESLVLPDCMNHTERVIEAVKERHVTAVQCVNDKVACQVIRKLEQEGYCVPEDISVAGFDNSAEAEYFHPRITTMHQPFEEMGRVAAEKLLQMLNEKTSHSQTYLPVGLVIGESACPPKNSV